MSLSEPEHGGLPAHFYDQIRTSGCSSGDRERTSGDGGRPSVGDMVPDGVEKWER